MDIMLTACGVASCRRAVKRQRTTEAPCMLEPGWTRECDVKVLTCTHSKQGTLEVNLSTKSY